VPVSLSRPEGVPGGSGSRTVSGEEVSGSAATAQRVPAERPCGVPGRLAGSARLMEGGTQPGLLRSRVEGRQLLAGFGAAPRGPRPNRARRRRPARLPGGASRPASQSKLYKMCTFWLGAITGSGYRPASRDRLSGSLPSPTRPPCPSPGRAANAALRLAALAYGPVLRSLAPASLMVKVGSLSPSLDTPGRDSTCPESRDRRRH
jgi:hypothetical protein